MNTNIKEGDIVFHKSNSKILFVVSSIEKSGMTTSYKCKRVNDDCSVVEIFFTNNEIKKIEM